MALDDPVSIENGIRDLTEEEVRAYQRNGWVKLDGFVHPDVVQRVLANFKQKMGEGADADVNSGFGVKTSRPPQAKLLFNAYENPSNDDELIRQFTFSAGLGRALSRCAGSRVRFWGDNCYVKMPVSTTGGKTPWHQDWPYYPFDRGGSLTVWIALVDIPPERGPMRFVNGSHLWGPLGRVIGREDGLDTLDILPEFLRDRIELSPEHHLKAGDATIHNDMTIHSAPVNATQDPRWVYALSAFPADTLFTGCPQRRTDGLDLALNRPLDHPNFPVLEI